jgi:HPt (histidine-containing phosphotransfer) domain-containing protein
MMSEPVLDLSILAELERRLGRDRILKVVSAQIANGRDMARRFAVLELAPDAVSIKALAHQIAGSSGSIGLGRLSSLAASVEVNALAATPAALPGLAHAMQEGIEAALAALVIQYPEISEA